MIRPCPICNFGKTELLHTQYFSNNYSHKISSCLNCGFVFVSNTPSENFYKNYYKNSSKYEGNREHEPHEAITKKVLKEFIIKNIKKNSKILDVGCSTGAMLSHIKKEGYNKLYGFDPAPLCKKIARTKYQLSIKTDDIFSYKTKTKFDFIIVSQILEHLKDLKKNINKIENLLSNEGYIFVGVPNIENSELKYGEPFMEFSTEHINFFSFNYLTKLFIDLTCVFKYTDSLVMLTIWKKNKPLKNLVKKYIDNSNIKIKEIIKNINKINTKVIVWGAGGLAQKLLKDNQIKKNILLFVDSNKNLIGKKLSGLDIISPSELYNYSQPILVLSYRYRDEIIKNIKKQRYTNKIITI